MGRFVGKGMRTGRNNGDKFRGFSFEMIGTWDWLAGDPWHVVPDSFFLEKMLPQDGLRVNGEPNIFSNFKFKGFGTCSRPKGQIWGRDIHRTMAVPSAQTSWLHDFEELASHSIHGLESHWHYVTAVSLWVDRHTDTVVTAASLWVDGTWTVLTQVPPNYLEFIKSHSTWGVSTPVAGLVKAVLSVHLLGQLRESGKGLEKWPLFLPNVPLHLKGQANWKDQPSHMAWWIILISTKPQIKIHREIWDSITQTS